MDDDDDVDVVIEYEHVVLKVVYMNFFFVTFENLSCFDVDYSQMSSRMFC